MSITTERDAKAPNPTTEFLQDALDRKNAKNDALAARRQAYGSEKPLPAFCTLAEWYELSGMRQTMTFAKIKTGDIKVRKLGRRTLVDVAASMAWLRALPGNDQAA